MQWAKKQTGFTIVELLIVVIVIAILATITIVSFNNIQNRSHDTVVQNDLNSLMKKVLSYNAEFSRYPTSVNDFGTYAVSKGSYAVTPTTNFNVTTCFRNGQDFAMIAMSRSGNKYYFVASEGSVKQQSGTGWYVDSGAACTSVMTTATNYNGYVSTDTSGGPWRSWAGGN